MNIKNNTICIFSPAFPQDESETAWLPWLQNLIKAINYHYPAIRIVIFAFQYPHSTTSYKWRENIVFPFNGMHKKKFSRMAMWLQILRTFTSVKRNNNVIGIFSLWCHECAFVGKYFERLFRVKHYCWILGQDARETNAYVKKIRPKAEQLVAASDFLQKEFYKNHHIQPAHIIPHGIDISLFSNDVPDRDIDIIGAGNLHPLKQYSLFLQIVGKLKQRLPSIKAIICGGGEEEEHLKKIIGEFSLHENVSITGMLDHSQVLQIMQRAKILLHPSAYEGFGTVCTEALYAGAHVVSFVKPVNHTIKNWHIVATKEEMESKALQLLQDANAKYENVLVYSIEDTAKRVTDLFGYYE